MRQILEAMGSILPRLEDLESQMTRAEFRGKSPAEMLGPDPQQAFSRLLEFKAALDRMRGLTWVYLEAAANAGRMPSQRIPPALKDFLQQQAAKSTKSQIAHTRRKAR